MWKIFNSWARAHRNARGIAAALAIWLALGAMWIMKCRSDRDPFQYREDIYVLLIAEQEDRGVITGRRGTVLLPDSTTIYLPLPPAPPDVGQKIPVWVEHYRSGKRVYGFDRQRWQTQGPG